ncbi:ATP-NAD kinase family protein [Brumicola nitratireducens]|uniref:ATP-NAD/AcoX kinase n=1 Tax=Glaciecola nitratireducens (strain JCM 12485 / KCTC 12276 / FR1064) TaxID=1085623 RepID=G4QHT2_GLANF|nr:ATP-NAD kinase family protein [Glaciecola nitratireducens]AEP30309.1 ATP-NAD/AcoX kinase [Glaciecola nitratireducens FR1064]
MKRRFKLGLLINPYSGIGGALALKGSDGADIRQQALASGAEKLSGKKMTVALQALLPLKDQLSIFTASGEMGEDVVSELGFKYDVAYQHPASQTESADTQAAALALMAQKVDLILFAGGDGTARNICEVVENRCPVVGVPAGCKIHSGVYAITPKAAGKVVAQVVKGELVSLMAGEVKDIDETEFRAGRVLAKHYGEMLVPEELSYIQAVKMGGKESDELVLSDIAAHVIELMSDEPDTLFVMGSGSTVDSIMQEMELKNTLLGVDLVSDQKLVASDLTAATLLQHCANKPTKIVLTLIGGQGHVLGRGNQQLSPELVNLVGKQNILVVATKSKLQSLHGRPLVSDSGDAALDDMLVGPIPVITGFHDLVLYSIGSV